MNAAATSTTQASISNQWSPTASWTRNTTVKRLTRQDLLTEEYSQALRLIILPRNPTVWLSRKICRMFRGSAALHRYAVVTCCCARSASCRRTTHQLRLTVRKTSCPTLSSSADPCRRLVSSRSPSLMPKVIPDPARRELIESPSGSRTLISITVASWTKASKLSIFLATSTRTTHQMKVSQTLTTSTLSQSTLTILI